MVRPKINIPIEDIKGLKTLINERKTQEEISRYYTETGIHANQSTISRRITELGL